MTWVSGPQGHRPEAPPSLASPLGRLQGAGAGIFISQRKGSPRTWSTQSFRARGPWGQGRTRALWRPPSHAREASGQTPTLGTLRPLLPPHVRGSVVTLLIAAPEERPHPWTVIALPAGMAEWPGGIPGSDGRGWGGHIVTRPGASTDVQRNKRKAAFKGHVFSLPPAAGRNISPVTALGGREKHA